MCVSVLLSTGCCGRVSGSHRLPEVGMLLTAEPSTGIVNRTWLWTSRLPENSQGSEFRAIDIRQYHTLPEPLHTLPEDTNSLLLTVLLFHEEPRSYENENITLILLLFSEITIQHTKGKFIYMDPPFPEQKPMTLILWRSPLFAVLFYFSDRGTLNSKQTTPQHFICKGAG